MLEANSRSKAITDAEALPPPDILDMTDMDMMSQPMTIEEMHVIVSDLVKGHKLTQTILAKHEDALSLHRRGLTSYITTMSKLSEATAANVKENEFLRKAITEMEQTMAGVVVDNFEEAASIQTVVNTLSTKIDSAQLAANRLLNANAELTGRVDNVETAVGSIASTQEISERARCSQSILVYGWPVNSSPTADATEFLTLIGYGQLDYITARRYNPSRRPTTSNFEDRPPILNITFLTVKHAWDALSAYCIHSGGSRTLTYWTKPDLTKQQLDAKRHADNGIRLLLKQNPQRIYREHSGRIAEFKRIVDGELVFDKWIPDPLRPNTNPFRRPETRQQEPIISNPSPAVRADGQLREASPATVANNPVLGKRHRSVPLSSPYGGSDDDDSDLDRTSLRQVVRRRSLSNTSIYFPPAATTQPLAQTAHTPPGSTQTAPGSDYVPPSSPTSPDGDVVMHI